MKVAVYSIALNEEKFVRRWYESAKEADYLLIADTGSTDNTVALAKELGIDVKSIFVKPWRFDDARNASLAIIPSDIDICVQLDLDEILFDGWKNLLLESLKEGANRVEYKYVWSWQDTEETEPDVAFTTGKIHSRFGYRWKHACHEVLVHYGESIEKRVFSNLEIHHHPDHLKSRSNYLGLLAMAVKEDPHSSRDSYYFARELFFAKQLPQAEAEFKRYLLLPGSNWGFERSKAKRYLAKIDPVSSVRWLLESHLECPNIREPLVELAQVFQGGGRADLALHYALRATSITDRALGPGSESFAWGSLVWDIASLASYKLGDRDGAVIYASKALDLDPNNARISRNLGIFMSEFTVPTQN